MKHSGGYGDCKPCEEKANDVKFWNAIKDGETYSPSSVYITNAGHKGMGVFAKCNIKENEPIEYCHSMILNERFFEVKDSKIRQYAYNAYDEFSISLGNICIIPFGFGEIYNSAESQEEANAKFSIYLDQELIVFRATKDIEKDSEILVWWGSRYYNDFIKNKGI